MQLSEAFRRAIVCPLSDAACESLLNGDVNHDIDVAAVHIETDELFYSIWETGVFELINQRSGTMIDDYEEEVVPFEYLPEVLESVRRMIKETASHRTDIQLFFVSCEAVCRKAVDLHRPLFFIF